MNKALVIQTVPLSCHLYLPFFGSVWITRTAASNFSFGPAAILKHMAIPLARPEISVTGLRGNRNIGIKGFDTRSNKTFYNLYHLYHTMIGCSIWVIVKDSN